MVLSGAVPMLELHGFSVTPVLYPVQHLAKSAGIATGNFAQLAVLLCQVAAAHNLMENTRKTVEGRAKLGIEAFAQALLGIPKILAENSGYDAQETIIQIQVRAKVDR